MARGWPWLTARNWLRPCGCWTPLRRTGSFSSGLRRGEDGPLWGVREGLSWRDEIYLSGFGHSCSAVRWRRSSLLVPGGLPVTERVDGDAIEVLHTVICDWPA
jgi:hypothetical protein